MLKLATSASSAISTRFMSASRGREMETMFATCPNCSSPMKLEFTRDVTEGHHICFQTKVADIYEGKCSLCNLKMEIVKPVK